MNSLKKRASIFAFFACLIAVVLVWETTHAMQQDLPLCESNTAFAEIADAYKRPLVSRIAEFLRNKHTENIAATYEMLTPDFRERNAKALYVKEMTEYYSGDDRFVAFEIERIGESRSVLDNKPGLWFIHGCLTEIVNGKSRSAAVELEAVRIDEQIFFSDITTRPVLNGNAPCRK